MERGHSGIKTTRIQRVVDLFVSDALKGIEDALTSVFSQDSLQFCTVHLERNVLKHIKKKDKPQVIEAIKEVFKTDDPSYNPHKDWSR